ncbi:MAG: NADH-quinone oxidoreductase subunit J [Bryobacterales bacterium]|nr:NADH-quinone oxidoreductase subunit J [Bryobacterales bacterium]
MNTVFFLVFGLIVVVCAINVVVQRHPISSAISLIGVMGSLAIIYLQLGAEFMAAAQIIVYTGAVMVLFIFVIMLLNAGSEEGGKGPLTVRLLGVPLLLVFLGLLSYLIQRLFSDTGPVRFGDFKGGSPADVGRALFSTYLLPFEITSVLILIAILGAIVLARKELD